MLSYIRQQSSAGLSLEQAAGIALRAWAVGNLAQRMAREATEGGQDAPSKPIATDTAVLYAHLGETVAEKTIECALLDRNQPGSSKYRMLTSEELGRLLPKDIKPSLS